nr:unnamed protein product [Callosobruchus analis]
MIGEKRHNQRHGGSEFHKKNISRKSGTKDIVTSISKRATRSNESQNIVEAEPHKTLRLSQTRWLSLQGVATRILQQWDALVLYLSLNLLLSIHMEVEKF